MFITSDTTHWLPIDFLLMIEGKFIMERSLLHQRVSLDRLSTPLETLCFTIGEFLRASCKFVIQMQMSGTYLFWSMQKPCLYASSIHMFLSIRASKAMAWAVCNLPVVALMNSTNVTVFLKKLKRESSFKDYPYKTHEPRPTNNVWSSSTCSRQWVHIFECIFPISCRYDWSFMSV